MLYRFGALFSFLLIVPSALAADESVLLRWGRFESKAEVAKWRKLDVTFEQSTKFVTEGRFSARLHFHRYTGAKGEAQWPRVTAFSADGLYPKDWSRWRAVALDLTADTPEGAIVSIEIRDRKNKNGWSQPFPLPPQSTLRLVIPLATVKDKVDLSHVEEFLIYKGRPKADVDIYVDNVRLLGAPMMDLHAAIEKSASAVANLWRTNPEAQKLRAQLAELRRAAAAPLLSAAQAKRLAERLRALEQSAIRSRLQPLRAFDFGPAGSPVRTGFVGVTHDDVYRADRGYGWRSTEGLRSFSRPAEREWKMSTYYGRKIPPPVYLIDLDQDFVAGRSAAEFVIDVPAGDYVVWMLAGVAGGFAPQVNRFTVDAGAGAQRIGLPQKYVFESRFLPAKAGDDGLHVRFTPETGFVIDALAVFPADQLRRARREFAGPIDDEIFKSPPELWAQWREVRRAAETANPPPTAEERRRGFVVFARPFVQNVYPNSRPRAGERCSTLRTFATPGEYEPFTFSVWALRPLEDVTVEVTDLRATDGATIPRARIDLRQVRAWPVRLTYTSPNTYKIVPEILDPMRPTDLEAGVARRYWITVHLPDDAPPGIYRGRATIRARGARAAHVELTLEALPFRLLRDPTKDFGNYYYWPDDRIPSQGDPAVAQAIRRRMEAELRDMQEHGMTTIQMRGISAKKVDGRWKAVIDLDDRIALLKRFGLWSKDRGVMMPVFPNGIKTMPCGAA